MVLAGSSTHRLGLVRNTSCSSSGSSVVASARGVVHAAASGVWVECSVLCGAGDGCLGLLKGLLRLLCHASVRAMSAGGGVGGVGAGGGGVRAGHCGLHAVQSLQATN